MKKGISKFLSIVLSTAMVSPMVGMNSTKALNPPVDVNSPRYESAITEWCGICRDYMDDEAQKFFENEVGSELKSSCSSEERIRNLKQSLAHGYIPDFYRVRKEVITSVSKFLEKRSGKNLQYYSFNCVIVRSMMKYMKAQGIRRANLEFLNCFGYALKNTTLLDVDKEELTNLGDAIESVNLIIKTLGKYWDVIEDTDKEICHDAIANIIIKMSSGLTKDDVEHISSISNYISKDRKLPLSYRHPILFGCSIM